MYLFNKEEQYYDNNDYPNAAESAMTATHILIPLSKV